VKPSYGVAWKAWAVTRLAMATRDALALLPGEEAVFTKDVALATLVALER